MALINKLTAIADAIRSKTETTEKMTLDEMPSAIEGIQSGGTDRPIKACVDAIGRCQILCGYNGTDANEKVAELLHYDDTENATDTSYMFYKAINLTEVPQFDTSKVTNMDGMFNGCNVVNIPSYDTSEVTTMYYTFANNSSLKTVGAMDTSKVTNFAGAFSNSSNLETIGLLDFSSVISSANIASVFLSASKIKNISFVKESIKVGLSNYIKHMNLLSDESIQSIIDGLATVKTAQTLQLHADVKAKLTEAQISQITSKNWTLA